MNSPLKPKKNKDSRIGLIENITRLRMLDCFLYRLTVPGLRVLVRDCNTLHTEMLLKTFNAVAFLMLLVVYSRAVCDHMTPPW